MMKILVSSALLLLCFGSLAQQAVSIGSTNADPAAILDVQSTQKGLLIPRLTSAQRNAMPNKAAGLLVYDTDKLTLMMYNGASWTALIFGDPASLPPSYAEPATQIFGQGYGCSVSVWGNWAAVGAFGHREQFESGDYGAVYMYERVSGVWQFRQLLKASDRASGDRFGTSVSLSGQALLVGASLADLPGKPDAGKAYTFRLSGQSWVQEKVLTASNSAAEDYFGTSVALSGGLGVVGAPGKEYVNQPPTRNNEGAIYVYRYADFVPELWVEDYRDTWDQGQGESRYGSSVAIDSAMGILVAGVPGANSGRGVAAIKYRQGEPNWAFTVYLTPPVPGAGAGRFGSSVSIKGLFIAVGSPLEAASIEGNLVQGTGRTYVYKNEFGSWNLHGNVPTPTAVAGDQIGASVAIFPPYLVVGMPGRTVNGQAGQGQTAVYKLGTTGPFNSPIWVFQRNITDGTNTANNFFGSASALHNGNLLTGGSFFQSGNGKVAFINVE